MRKDKKNWHPGKKFLNWIFILAMGIVELVLIYLLFYVIGNITAENGNLFKSLALGIIIMWIAILVGYLAWAVYFYNINLGLTNEDWDEVKQLKAEGKHVCEREHNPHANETLGLPPGTVRGIMALSLLMGALSMMIAALGSDNTYSENVFFVDNFEFFKTAFLMMIAFYFGDKSLKHLRKQDGNSVPTEPTVPTVPPHKHDIDLVTGDPIYDHVDMDSLRSDMYGEEDTDESEEEDADDDFDVDGAQG